MHNLSPRRLITVHLLTPSMVDEYRLNLRATCTRYYNLLANHSVYAAVPTENFTAVVQALTGHTLTGHARSGKLFSWGRSHAAADAACTAELFLVAVDIGLPARYAGKRLDELGGACAGGRYRASLAWDLYSGAFFSAHLLWQPWLDRADFYLKIDTDIFFGAPMPFDLGEKLASMPITTQVFHTGLAKATALCENGVGDALMSFRLAYNITTPMVGWCGHEPLPRYKSGVLFYGNFVAFRVSFMRSAPVQALSRYLWETEASSGYFETARWGDQGPWTAFACLGLQGPSNWLRDGRTQELGGLRGKVFEHGRQPRDMRMRHAQNVTWGR